MKRALLKPRRRRYYLHSGLLVLAMKIFLVSASLGQLDDTTIAFMSSRNLGWKTEIFLMNPDGEQIRPLTEPPELGDEPAWSPNGKQISFISYRDLKRVPKNDIPRGEIYLINADGTNLINRTHSPEKADGVSSWSPNGQQIVFTSAQLLDDGETLANSDIFVMAADGGNPINLTNHDALDQTPDWSPDGLKIAFSSLRDGNWEIYVMKTDGANSINLTNHPAKDGRPDWSPDGRQIAFTSDRDGNLEIYVMNADGTNPTNLTNHPGKDNHSSWSPDGTRIAFESYRDGDFNGEIYMMNADGTRPINLTNHPNIDTSPSWGTSHPLGVSPNRKLATLWGKVKHVN